MKFNISFADREYAREQGDPTLGTVEADTREEALLKARQDTEIAAKASGHLVGLWAHPVRDQQVSERGRRPYTR